MGKPPLSTGPIKLNVMVVAVFFFSMIHNTTNELRERWAQSCRDKHEAYRWWSQTWLEGEDREDELHAGQWRVRLYRGRSWRGIDKCRNSPNPSAPPGSIKTCIVWQLKFKDDNKRPRETYGEGGLAVERLDADVVVVLQVTSIEEPADGGVRDGFRTAGEINKMIIPGPRLTHRGQGKGRRVFDRDVAVLGVITALG